ncbi:MAG: septation protein SepH [Micrococcales bacterium]
MTDLRLNGTDGDFLNLESQDGSHFRLAIDESLKSAVRNHTTFDKTSLTLTPREIQAEIRAGATVEELVKRWNDPIEYVAKFAQPIIDELGHIVQAAKGVRISIAGDRYNDVSHTEFGEIISARLDASDARAVNWNAARDETGTWRVTVNYTLSGEEGQAIWSFDPRKLILSPENQNAIALSTQNSLTSNASKLAAVETATFATEQLADTLQVDTVIPIGRSSEQSLVTPVAVEREDLATTSDLLEALKKKRASREHPSTQSVEIEVTAVTSPAEVQTVEVSKETEPEPRPAPTKRTGRPSIPSFDEIVQGTKSDVE